MLSRSLLLPRLASQSSRFVQTSSCLGSGHHIEHWWGPEKAAGRVQVGFGASGDEVVVAASALVIAAATFYAVFLNIYVYPEVPPTFQNEYKEAQIQRQIVLEKGAFLGPAAYWDYENNQWKK